MMLLVVVSTSVAVPSLLGTTVMPPLWKAKVAFLGAMSLVRP